jgi:four helix bundle protein
VPPLRYDFIIRDYRQLQVWRRSDKVVMGVYRLTHAMTMEERYGLRSQIRRAAVSVPTNIAEGCGRYSKRDLRRFLDIAAGSASELEYLLDLSVRLGVVSGRAAIRLVGEVGEVKKTLEAYRKTIV